MYFQRSRKTAPGILETGRYWRQETIGGRTMEIAQQSGFEATRREVGSHDSTILVGYSVFAVLFLIAIYWGAMSSGIAPGDFASMTVFP
jgi:hypothetical protein